MPSAYNQAVRATLKDQKQDMTAAQHFNESIRAVANMMDAEMQQLMPGWLHRFLVKRNSNTLFKLSNILTGIKVEESLENKWIKLYKRGNLIKTFYLGKDIIVS